MLQRQDESWIFHLGRESGFGGRAVIRGEDRCARLNSNCNEVA